MKLFDAAHQALNQALPLIPMDSVPYSKVLKLVSDMNKLKTEFGEGVAATKQTMMQLMQQIQKAKQMQAIGNVGSPANAPPAMPPPVPAPAPAPA